MKYEEIKDLTEVDFKRLTGIRISTFSRMMEILIDAQKEKMKFGGKPALISLENKLLMALEYWREYRTYFHISKSYGISESQCFRNTIWIENILIKDGTFSLPGKKELLKSDNEIEVILIDATESVIERPQKNKRNITQEKRKNIP